MSPVYKATQLSSPSVFLYIQLSVALFPNAVVLWEVTFYAAVCKQTLAQGHNFGAKALTDKNPSSLVAEEKLQVWGFFFKRFACASACTVTLTHKHTFGALPPEREREVIYNKQWPVPKTSQCQPLLAPSAWHQWGRR